MSMFTLFSPVAFVARIKKRARDKRVREGYDYAAGVLLHDGDVERIRSEISVAVTFDSFDSFDEGIERALQDYLIYVKRTDGYVDENA